MNEKPKILIADDSEINRALLKAQYGIQHWDIPQDYLCPPVPGRAGKPMQGAAAVRRCPGNGHRAVACCPPDTAIGKPIRRRSQLRGRAGALHFVAQNY